MKTIRLHHIYSLAFSAGNWTLCLKSKQINKIFSTTLSVSKCNKGYSVSLLQSTKLDNKDGSWIIPAISYITSQQTIRVSSFVNHHLNLNYISL